MWLESIDKGNVIPSPLNLVYYSLLLLRVMINVILMIPRIICCCLCRCNCKKARIILRLQNVLVNTRIYASCCFSAMTGGLWFPSLPVKVIAYTFSDLVGIIPIPYTRQKKYVPHPEQPMISIRKPLIRMWSVTFLQSRYRKCSEWYMKNVVAAFAIAATKTARKVPRTVLVSRTRRIY